MKCPVCGIEIDALPCERCEAEAIAEERRIENLVEAFSLVRGAPRATDDINSLNSALAHLQRQLHRDSFRGIVTYDERDLLCAQNWWYIPYRWIGCGGFIVNKTNHYVNCLGSGLSLDDCFWGHERGVFCDLVDFTFAPETDRELVAMIVRRFKKVEFNPENPSHWETHWYDRRNIAPVIDKHFPTFKCHFVWFGIPEIRQACREHDLRFTSVIASQAEQGAADPSPKAGSLK
jgi:hypothetical protein